MYENDFPDCRECRDSVLFVDDDTDCVSEKNPMVLVERLQREANNSCEWLKDNRMCVRVSHSKNFKRFISFHFFSYVKLNFKWGLLTNILLIFNSYTPKN